MNKAESLDHTINRFGFWSVIVVLATGVIAMAFPLDVPGGYTAEHADRVSWLSANSGMFIAGWVNQIVAMFSLSAVFACGAIAAVDIEAYFIGASLLLLVHIVAMAFVFRKSM